MKYKKYIDAHNHIYNGFSINELEAVLQSYNINICIASQIGCDKDTNDAVIANELAVDFALQSELVKCQFFFDPRYHIVTPRLIKYILDNRNIFVGIKLHSHISQTPANSSDNFDILDLAQNNNIPVMFHTDDSDLCGISQMQDVIDRFPNLILVLGHAFLNVSTHAVVCFMEKNPTVYAETSWANHDKVIELLAKIPSHRLMFGTDAPVDGELGRGVPLDIERSCFRWYIPLLERLQQLDDNVFNSFMVDTAVKVYDLK